MIGRRELAFLFIFVLMVIAVGFGLGGATAASADAGQTTLVSVDSIGAPGNNDSDRSAISADGRFVAFSSRASNLVPGDTNECFFEGPPGFNCRDIFVHDRQTGETTRVSVSSDGTQGNKDSNYPAISPDGRFVAFSSDATNLVPDDTNDSSDIFVHDSQTKTTSRISVNTAGTQGNGFSKQPSISADGRFVAFSSGASNLVTDDTNNIYDPISPDIFVHDRQVGITTRVSVSTSGAEADSPSESAVISADGRFVAFTSWASNLVPDDTNSFADIFVHDRQSGTTTRVSASTSGTEADSPSENAVISADGRFVAFTSWASNLAPDDTNSFADIFVHDRQTKTTSLSSVNTAGSQGNDGSSEPSISADGRFVAFTSRASNLVPNDTNSFADIFVHDRQTKTTSLSSANSSGTQGNGGSFGPSISTNGRLVAFSSNASNLVPNDTNICQYDDPWSGGIQEYNCSDVFVHDWQPVQVSTATPTTTASQTQTPTVTGTPSPSTTPTSTSTATPTLTVTNSPTTTRTATATATNPPTSTATSTNPPQTATSTNPPPPTPTPTSAPPLPPHSGATTLVSMDSRRVPGNGSSTLPSISTDGRYVAFSSPASNLVPGDDNGASDVFVHDRQAGVTTRVSVSSGGVQGNSYSVDPSISADGRFVAFQSLASNLVPGDTNFYNDIFVHDKLIGETTRVSVSSDGTQGNSHSMFPSISADGRYVAFATYASNLVPGDTMGQQDIFVHDRQTGATTRVSVSSGGGQGNGYSANLAISADGWYVTFFSQASNLVPGDTNGTWDTFVHNRKTRATTRVSVSSNGTQGNSGSGFASISADGRYVAFFSEASNLVPSDTNDKEDVFVHDRQTGETTRVSVSSGGAQGNANSRVPVISADGRYVAFMSTSSNLISGDTNNQQDIFIHDRQTEVTKRVSVNSSGVQANDDASGPAISADGRYVAFDSSASNLVPGDRNEVRDVFVHDRTAITGFQRGVDGFQFENRGSSMTELLGDFTWEEMRELFGDDEVCYMVDGRCIVRPLARLWYSSTVIKLVKLGLKESAYCYGFAATSLLLFTGLGAENRNEPQDFMAGAENTHQIDNWYLMHHYIALNQIKQLLSPIVNEIVKDSPNAILGQVIKLVQEGIDPPLIMLFDTKYSHALVAMSVESRGNGVYWVHVYDSNNPVVGTTEIDTYVEFDTVQNSWRYDNKNPLGVVSGDDSSIWRSSIWMLPISKHASQAIPPWSLQTLATNKSSSSMIEATELSLLGDGHLLVTDQVGNRVGFTEEGFVNEIPGATVNWLIGGLGVSAEPTYRIPSHQSYTVILDGNTVNTTSRTGIAKFDKNSAAIISNIAVSTDSRDAVIIFPSRSIVYNPSNSQEVNIQLATEAKDGEYLIELIGTDLEGNNSVMLEFDESRNEVSISHADASDSEYSLQLTRIDGVGEARFVHDMVRIGAGETQIVKLHTWTHQEVTVCTDMDSDGQTENCETLQNEFVSQGDSIFMPFIIR